MNITIKPLTPELSADYFDFFENRAFTDNSPYRCYCQMYQMTKAQAKAALDNADGADMGGISKKIAEQQIESGILRGYLAFVDGIAVGWCNTNDKANFPVEPCTGESFYAPPEKREKAVVCFEIAPKHRGRGVATALLHQAIFDAKTEGYIAVEGFPVVRDERYEWDCTGPFRLYEKTGFSKVSEKDGRIIMRKEL
ncbi:MAG: GNAT family N-acetyltransferase [Oscillospiraceae bacterium]|jgi:GNAT superfamily N-acetyltransferase|nr:GNAT family N-acetyltransferase [Oscillospiraceae bacterium]